MWHELNIFKSLQPSYDYLPSNKNKSGSQGWTWPLVLCWNKLIWPFDRPKRWSTEYLSSFFAKAKLSTYLRRNFYYYVLDELLSCGEQRKLLSRQTLCDQWIHQTKSFSTAIEKKCSEYVYLQIDWSRPENIWCRLLWWSRGYDQVICLGMEMPKNWLFTGK